MDSCRDDLKSLTKPSNLVLIGVIFYFIINTINEPATTGRSKHGKADPLRAIIELKYNYTH